LLIAGIIVSVLPDLDVISFHFHLPYAQDFGHRGASHSLLFAGLLALLGASAFYFFRASITRVFSFLFLAAASHGLLDAFTNGGSGIAFFWPFSATRYFAPFHPIEVSPLTLSRIMSARLGDVLLSELRWVWLPCAVLMLIIIFARRYNRQVL